MTSKRLSVAMVNSSGRSNQFPALQTHSNHTPNLQIIQRIQPQFNHKSEQHKGLFTCDFYVCVNVKRHEWLI